MALLDAAATALALAASTPAFSAAGRCVVFPPPGALGPHGRGKVVSEVSAP